MANQRDIKNRIKSIKNICKITSTMEMVSTSKMKKFQDRLEKSKAFDLKLTGVLNNIFSVKDAEYSDPLLHGSTWPTRVLILEIVGNRGLCGSFNSNIMKKTASFIEDLFIKEGKDSSIYSIGKKGINHYSFIKQNCYKTMPNPDDSLSFKDAANLGQELMSLFLRGEFHEIYVSYSKVVSQSSQKAEIIKLLPLNQLVNSNSIELASVSSDYYYSLNPYNFEPNPNRVFSHLLPLFVKAKIYSSFLETSYSEFFARRVAMKNATDASNDMISDLTVAYNHARQGKITNEILEIIGGAAGLE